VTSSSHLQNAGKQAKSKFHHKTGSMQSVR